MVVATKVMVLQDDILLHPTATTSWILFQWIDLPNLFVLLLFIGWYLYSSYFSQGTSSEGNKHVPNSKALLQRQDKSPYRHGSALPSRNQQPWNYPQFSFLSTIPWRRLWNQPTSRPPKKPITRCSRMLQHPLVGIQIQLMECLIPCYVRLKWYGRASKLLTTQQFIHRRMAMLGIQRGFQQTLVDWKLLMNYSFELSNHPTIIFQKQIQQSMAIIAEYLNQEQDWNQHQLDDNVAVIFANQSSVLIRFQLWKDLAWSWHHMASLLLCREQLQQQLLQQPPNTLEYLNQARIIQHKLWQQALWNCAQRIQTLAKLLTHINHYDKSEQQQQQQQQQKQQQQQQQQPSSWSDFALQIRREVQQSLNNDYGFDLPSNWIRILPLVQNYQILLPQHLQHRSNKYSHTSKYCFITHQRQQLDYWIAETYQALQAKQSIQYDICQCFCPMTELQLFQHLSQLLVTIQHTEPCYFKSHMIDLTT